MLPLRFYICAFQNLLLPQRVMQKSLRRMRMRRRRRRRSRRKLCQVQMKAQQKEEGPAWSCCGPTAVI